MNINQLYTGIVISNRELADTFLCSTQGGMRRSKRTNSLVLISNHANVYHDRWSDGIFLYTGMGLTGDQDFHYMQNRTLYESTFNGIDVHLFEVFRPNEYTYAGQVELAAAPYKETQPDQNNNMRSVCIFPLKLRQV